MTNIIKLELTGYNNQKLSNLHPNLWRKFSNLDFSDNICFPTKDEVNNSLRKAFESVLGSQKKMTLYKLKLRMRKSNQNVFNVNNARKFITKRKLNVMTVRSI